MWAGYMSLAGTEIVNSARAVAFGAPVKCIQGCKGLLQALGDEPYTSPDMDPAPWWDPAEPASKKFHGIAGIDVEGMSKGVVTREPTPLIEGGAIPGRAYSTHKEILFKVLLSAADECGLAYGIGWLASVLKGSACGVTGACVGDEMCMFTCCPPERAPGETPGPGDAEIRSFYDVAVIEGPEITARHRLNGGGGSVCRGEPTGGPSVIAEAEFTVAAGQPWAYSQPLWLAEDAKPSRVIRTDWTWGLPGECRRAPHCFTDPACPAPALPPAPPIPQDPCFPEGAYNAAYLRVAGDYRLTPHWFTSVPIILIRTGDRPMRKIQVRFYTNSPGYDCGTLDRCAACWAVGLPYLPAKSTFWFDARAKVSKVWCVDSEGFEREANANEYMYGPWGRAMSWPYFQCGSGVCAEVLAEDSPSTEVWKVDLALASRQDAI